MMTDISVRNPEKNKAFGTTLQGGQKILLAAAAIEGLNTLSKNYSEMITEINREANSFFQEQPGASWLLWLALIQKRKEECINV